MTYTPQQIIDEQTNCVPINLIPKGFYLFRLGYSKTTRLWSAQIHSLNVSCSETQFSGRGECIRDAFFDALERVNLFVREDRD